MKLLFQLIKEFWLPLTAATLWAGYNLYDIPESTWSLKTFINIFAPTFFFISWLASQWFRVRRQQEVYDGLKGIESNLQNLVGELALKTKDIADQISGGNSFCYLTSGQRGPTTLGLFVLVHQGKYPLYDVTVRVVDLEAFAQMKGHLTFENLQKSELHRAYGDLIPGHAFTTNEQWALGDGDVRRFNLFFTARNGSFIQLLRYRKVDGQWKCATKVERDRVLFEQVQDGYPRRADGTVDWENG